MEYDNLTDEDLKAIVKDGIKSEFWGWLKHGLERTRKQAEIQLTQRSISTLDQCVGIAKFNAIWKTVDEIINTPENVLKTFEVNAKNSSKPKDEKQGSNYVRAGKTGR